jgi:hypothetical protein
VTAAATRATAAAVLRERLAAAEDCSARKRGKNQLTSHN